MAAKKTDPHQKSPAPRPVPPAIPTKPINIAVLAGFVLLALVLTLVFIAYYGGPSITGEEWSTSSLCTHGDTKPCTTGPCNGTAICINGIWSSCRWEKVCVPGTRLSCTKLSCFYAVRECNQCGTGYGPCVSP
ncbi:hypothetical protein H0O00_02110 [Candidatus Micrarchaeota archaeon]|nr:hypothetical protein [Candidatus Micrarchaeota archaeon]